MHMAFISMFCWQSRANCLGLSQTKTISFHCGIGIFPRLLEFTRTPSLGTLVDTLKLPDFPKAIFARLLPLTPRFHVPSLFLPALSLNSQLEIFISPSILLKVRHLFSCGYCLARGFNIPPLQLILRPRL